jgi:hypothetical protein
MGYRKEELRYWHLPLSADTASLRAVFTQVMTFGNSQVEVPLIVRLVENPKYQLPVCPLFHGAVTLRQHDFVHIILGRGYTITDEAFVIGFTMGTTDKVSTLEAWLYCQAACHVYPKAYRFKRDHARIFRDAVAAGYISACHPLDTFNFEDVLDLPLRDIRQMLGLEHDLLQACYEIEAKRFPHLLGSRRLTETATADTDEHPNPALPFADVIPSPPVP